MLFLLYLLFLVHESLYFQHIIVFSVLYNLDYYIIGSLTEDINNNGIPDAVYYVVSLNDDNIDVKEQHIKL